MTEKIETLARGLRALLGEIRKAKAEIMADPRAKVPPRLSSVRTEVQHTSGPNFMSAAKNALVST